VIPLSKQLVLVWRKLSRTPGFSVVAIFTLALGIGANTAIYSVVHAVLLEPLPFERPQELYGLWHTGHGLGIPQVEQSNTTYTVYHDESESFSAMGLYQADFSMSLTSEGEPVRLGAASATASLFDVLGVSALVGRTFMESEDDAGAADVVLLSYEMWRGRFGGDPNILGRTLTLDSTPWEIVGVMPASFAYPRGDTQIWIPHVITSEELGKANFSYDAVGRLKPGVSVEAANAELAGLLKRMPEMYPGELTAGLLESAQLTPYLSPLLEDIVGNVSQVLWILLGTVGFVLLIACANVANLFLVRAEGRQRELALRTALGASRGDLVQYFLTEALALSLLGGIVGVGLAGLALRVLIGMSPDNIPRLAEVGLHPQVLAFTAVVSLVSGLFFGLIPVIRYRRPNIVGAINEGSLRASSGRETNLVRSALVVAQIALALVLLIGSGLMARSFWELKNVHPGFEPNNLLTLRMSLPRAEYPEPEDAAGFYQRLFSELSALPGVTGVGGVSKLPTTDGQNNSGLVLEDFPLTPDEIPPIVRTNYATPGYFQTLGIPLREGRGFELRDHEQQTGAVIVSADFAKTHWPDASAIGRRVAPGLPVEDMKWYSIVGVVGDVRDDGLAQDAPAMVYFPVIGLGGEFGDWTIRTMSVALRTSSDPMSLAPAAREKLWALDSRLPLISVRSGDALLAASTASTSYTMILLGISASVALLLGTIGIYGVISYIVSQRTREIGVRMALGAGRADVNRMVVGQGLRLALLGVGIGLAGALAATQLMSSLLFGVSSRDPLTFIVNATLLFVIAGVASFIPAWRASGLNPVKALHYE
jgi:putative ABC transport system permease protein